MEDAHQMLAFVLLAGGVLGGLIAAGVRVSRGRARRRGQDL
jgi:hypothetical protein